jgi:lipopolysaccharide export system protein LptC
MAQNLATYSRIVAWLKVILPLTALALLSTVFLLARAIDPEQSIPFADVDVKELAREPRITAPEFAGMTADGAAISITADVARTGLPTSEDIAADRLTAQFQTPDGAEILAQANQGAIVDASVATLEGNVYIRSTAGYRIETEQITLDLDRTDIETAGVVRGTGPVGTLTAGRMHMELRAGSGDSILVFKDGIRVLYDPSLQPEDTP